MYSSYCQNKLASEKLIQQVGDNCPFFKVCQSCHDRPCDSHGDDDSGDSCSDNIAVLSVISGNIHLLAKSNELKHNELNIYFTNPKWSNPLTAALNFDLILIPSVQHHKQFASLMSPSRLFLFCRSYPISLSFTISVNPFQNSQWQNQH